MLLTIGVSIQGSPSQSRYRRQQQQQQEQQQQQYPPSAGGTFNQSGDSGSQGAQFDHSGETGSQRGGGFEHSGGTGVQGDNRCRGGNCKPSMSTCTTESLPSGRFKVVCSGGGPPITTQHILWLPSNGSAQIVDIQVPNYKLIELIQAGFKAGPPSENVINVLVKRPDQDAQAQLDVNPGNAGKPLVNVEYEPIVSALPIHYPVDRPYSPLTGPLVPPQGSGTGVGNSNSNNNNNPYPPPPDDRPMNQQ